MNTQSRVISKEFGQGVIISKSLHQFDVLFDNGTKETYFEKFHDLTDEKGKKIPFKKLKDILNNLPDSSSEKARVFLEKHNKLKAYRKFVNGKRVWDLDFLRKEFAEKIESYKNHPNPVFITLESFYNDDIEPIEWALKIDPSGDISVVRIDSEVI